MHHLLPEQEMIFGPACGGLVFTSTPSNPVGGDILLDHEHFVLCDLTEEGSVLQIPLIVSIKLPGKVMSLGTGLTLVEAKNLHARLATIIATAEAHLAERR
jgi:hypothetical protein